MIATEHNFDNFWDVLDHLDRFGLTPVQFRIYCHLLRSARDGVVSESSESIAKVCKLTRITVLRVVVQLERMSMIVCDRAVGKKTVFHLQPPSLWQRSLAVENEATKPNKVVQFPVSTTVRLSAQVEACKPDIPVNEINSHQEELVPLKGTSPPVVDLVNQIDLSTALAGNEPELPLDAKLDAVRQMGCNAGQLWRNGQMEILVDGLFMSVESFMQRKIPSFKQILQPCERGLNLCKDVIAQIKQKIATAKCNKLETSQI